MMGPHRKAERRRRGAYHEDDNTMTKIDCLIEVAKKLREARALGERSSDRALVYFIDMTIAHVCDSLDARSETKEAAEDRSSRHPRRCVTRFPQRRAFGLREPEGRLLALRNPADRVGPQRPLQLERKQQLRLEPHAC